MRTLILSAACLLCACNSNGSQVQPGTDSGADATMGDASGDAGDAAEEALDAQSPCLAVTSGNPSPSTDCIYIGACPADCAMGTQSAYACNASSVPLPEAGDYPSEFEVPVGVVTVIGYEPSAYPWDAGAYVSCAPLTCVRWATADHVDGGSAWPTDPCGMEDAGPYAWVCPSFPGVVPATDAGCANAGDMNVIGGAGTGAPSQAVWCCGGSLPAADAGAGEASAEDAATLDAAEDSSGE